MRLFCERGGFNGRRAAPVTVRAVQTPRVEPKHAAAEEGGIWSVHWRPQSHFTLLQILRRSKWRTLPPPTHSLVLILSSTMPGGFRGALPPAPPP